MRKVLIYPRGGGGWWLHNLVLSLEKGAYIGRGNNNRNLFYDGIDVSSQFQTTHGVSNLEYPDPIFVSKKRFNNYANVVTKGIYSGLDPRNYSDFEKEPFSVQLNELINTASFHLRNNTSNCDFYNYASRDDVFVLEYDNIFTNPTEFINQLYMLMDKFEIVYTKNSDIVHTAIDNYTTSCRDVFAMYYNFSNIAWVAWCIAMLDENKIPIGGNVLETTNIIDIGKLIIPHQSMLNKESVKWMII